MYGFSYVAKSWPIDVGITMQYYTYDSYHVFISNWDNGTTYINGIRIYEKKLEGDILSQLHFGIFIQAGIYYVRINNGKHWSAGFRIPLK
jgi:hypothetical protein